jgi:hypothetical protein
LISQFTYPEGYGFCGTIISAVGCAGLSAIGAERKCRHGSPPAAIGGISENIFSSRAFLRLTDAVEKIQFSGMNEYLPGRGLDHRKRM